MTGSPRAPRVSAIVPAHDSGPTLHDTVRRLAEALDPAAGGEGGEILIVENGSADDTWERAQRLAAAAWPVPVRADRSPVGLGHAYATGLRRAAGDVALLTADDLPFGVSDLVSWRLAGRPAGIVIGSKAHDGSLVPRPVVRRVFTAGFTHLRRGVLHLDVGDTQGTVFVPTSWAREVAPLLTAPGYLYSTELIYLAHLQGLPITEIPVALEESASGGTRIRPGDVAQMASGLFALRRRRHDLSRRDLT